MARSGDRAVSAPAHDLDAAYRLYSNFHLLSKEWARQSQLSTGCDRDFGYQVARNAQIAVERANIEHIRCRWCSPTFFRHRICN